jgi:hypothetical protein
MLMENHHMVWMLQKLLPGSIPGKDYVLKTEYDPDGVTVVVPSEVLEWKLPNVPQPSQETLVNYWENTYQAQWEQMIAEQDAAEAARIAAVAANALL